MIILGIDPGYGRVGFAVVEKIGSRLRPVEFGLIETPPIAMPDRLKMIYERTLEIIDTHKPDAMATERLLFTVNKTTAMDVAKALGVIMLAGQTRGLQWREYSPPEVKQAVVGNGAADKASRVTAATTPHRTVRVSIAKGATWTQSFKASGARRNRSSGSRRTRIASPRWAAPNGCQLARRRNSLPKMTKAEAMPQPAPASRESCLGPVPSWSTRRVG